MANKHLDTSKVQANKGLSVVTGAQSLCARFILPLGIVFCESLLKASSTGGFYPQLVALIPFSVPAGELLQLLVSFLPTRRAQGIAQGIVLVLIGVAFSVEYFVYRQFKVFYDITTVFMGASDVAREFSGAAWAMILTPSGISRILLFLLPDSCAFCIL